MNRLFFLLLVMCAAYADRVVKVHAPIREMIVSEEPIELVSDQGIVLTQGGKVVAPKVRFKSVEAPQIHGEVVADEILICCKRGRLNLDDARLSGSITIDPKNVLIQSGGVDPATGNTFGNQSSSDVVIDGATLGIAIDSGTVTIQANTDIIVDDDVVGATSGNGLTLQAGRSISVRENRSVILNGGALNVTINDVGAVSDDRDSGDAVFSMDQDSFISTGGGDVVMAVGTFGLRQAGQVVMNMAQIDAGGGSVSMEGFAVEQASVYGVFMKRSSIETSGAGTVTLSGTGGSVGDKCYGIYLLESESGHTIQTEDGTITLTGTGGGGVGGKATFNMGLFLSGAHIKTIGTGQIDLNGTGGAGVDRNMGVICSSGSLVETSSGNIDITGNGGGTGDLNCGFRIEAGSIVRALSTGNLTVTGTGGGSQKLNFGVSLSGSGTVMSVADGALDINGTGSGTTIKNSGCVIEGTSLVESTGSGVIGITGIASMLGTDLCMGVQISSRGTQVKSSNGDITIDGTAHGSGNSNQGIVLYRESSVVSTGTGAGAGAIVLNGVGGAGPMNNCGINVNAEASITSVDGDITLTGTSMVEGTQGIEVLGTLLSSGTGVVTENNITP